MLPRPSIIKRPQDALVKRNGSVQLECHFKAATMEGFTYFIWLKDDKAINVNSSKYHFRSGTGPGTQHRMVTKLRIFEFSDEDEGKCSCYCKYNKLSVLRQIGVQHEIKSDNSSANIKLTGMHIHCTYLLYCKRPGIYIVFAYRYVMFKSKEFFHH